MSTKNSNISQLRLRIKQLVKEATESQPEDAAVAAAVDSAVATAPSSQGDDPNVGPEKHVAKGGLTVSNKPDMSLQTAIVEIAKSAAYGMERIELLKKRDFPTHKSANAVGTAVDALEMIFKDMLRNPMNYLDENPTEKVAEYEQFLDDESAKLAP